MKPQAQHFSRLCSALITGLCLLYLLAACTSSAAPPLPTTSSAPAVATPSPAPPAATFPAARLGTYELDVPYCTQTAPAASDQPARTMDMYYPGSGGPWPAVIYVHGGSWRELDKADGGYWAFLKDAGFVVVSVNYRLASAETHFPAMIEDLKCAVRHLRANASTYNLDAQHIGVIGWSAGGHLAALLGTADESAGWEQGEYLEQSSRVQAVVSIAGLSDLTHPMYADLSQSIAFAFGEAGGTPSPGLVAASPISHVTADDPPFFIVHGSLDPVVNFEQSQILHAWLTAAGVNSTFVQVEGGDHHLRDENASLTMEEIKVMVKEWLMQVLMAP